MSAPLRPLAVSIVIVNFRGAQDTIECVRSLQDLDWPASQREIIVVDNGSGDDSVAVLAAELGDAIMLVESGTNTGFSGGCNLGAAAATGEFLAFINNDATADRRWLRAAVATLTSNSTIGCVASKVLSPDGDIDFTAASLTWYGMGYKPGAGTRYTGDAEHERDVLFATGSAMVTRTELFREVGGFDERYFMFYEDVDLGWRMNLLGHRVRYVPSSVVVHRHHASIAKFAPFRERFLLERNALITLYKNAEQDGLDRALAPALLLSLRRTLAIAEADTGVLDLQRNPVGDGEATLTLSKDALTGAYAIDSFLDMLPSLVQTRSELQERRVVNDHRLASLMGNLLEPAVPNERYQQAHQILVEAFGLDRLYRTGRRILVVTGDPLAAKMSGPGIRAFHIAEALSTEHEVRLASTQSCSIDDPRFACAARTYEQLRHDVDWADVVIFQGFLSARAQWVLDIDKVIVADLYDPMHVEQLQQTRGGSMLERTEFVLSTVAVLNGQLTRGDFLLCANETQRHFWLGQLTAVGRLNPKTYDADSSLRSLIDVVPFGIPDTPAIQSASAIRGAIDGIDKTDKLVVWGGGIYDWFDPLTVIRAIHQLSPNHPDVRLFFLGTTHPNTDLPAMTMVEQARELSDDLGLTGRFVFFNDGWVDYNHRADYLLDADAGVSAHAIHLETELSYRTRMLDYLWAGLPIVTTAGDTFATLVQTERLGCVVPEGDATALAAALERCLYDAEFNAACRANIQRVRPQFTWSQALAPLLRFCREPVRAADAVIPDNPLSPRRQPPPPPPEPPPPPPPRLRDRLRSLPRRARAAHREGGPTLVAARTRRFIARRLRRAQPPVDTQSSSNTTN